MSLATARTNYPRPWKPRSENAVETVEFNTKVEKILVKNGNVVGVETSQSDRITTNHVVCNASPTTAYNYLVHPKEDVPKMAYKNVNARTEGVSSLVVYLGLDASPEELGLTEYSYFISDHMNTAKLYDSLSNLFNPQLQACTCPECCHTGLFAVRHDAFITHGCLPSGVFGIL